jgi:hypothetical protein
VFQRIMIPHPTMLTSPPLNVATLAQFQEGRLAYAAKTPQRTQSFSACVRHPAHADEVVECENVSTGGVCFHSLQQYELDALKKTKA